jgi:phage terminase large subunit-like protein
MTDKILLRQISQDRALASQILFPHRHPQASPPFHIEIVDLWCAADAFVSIEAFREGAKTTLSEEVVLTEALFHNFNYGIVIGETYTKACQRIEAIKHEIVTNSRIKALFGNQRGPVWSENKIVLVNGVAIEAHGWEEEFRGYKHLTYRPDRAYLDDIENKERVRDSDAVEANWKKLHLQLLPAMDKELGKIRLTGTPLADDCMVRRAAKSPNWVHSRFPICDRDIDDPNCVAAWPDRYSMEWIRATRDHYASEGMLSEFNQEYMLIPTGAQGKPFKQEHIWHIQTAPRGYMPRVVVIDPARTTDIKKSDQTGYAVLSRRGSRIYVHESGAKYWKPDEIIQAAFDLSHKHNDAEVAIEKNSLDEWLLQPIRTKMLSSGITLKLRAINAPQDRNKSQFIMGLHPFFEAGDIVLIGDHPNLEAQILNFPSGKKDTLNCLAYANKVFSGVPVYGDFSDANIVRNSRLPRESILLLACNTSGTETTAVLCSLTGEHLRVIADWISPLVANEAIPAFALYIKALYPTKPIKAWIPADVHDQQGRNPLVAALKQQHWKPERGEYCSAVRGSLSKMLREEVRGFRLLTVDANCHNTLHALSYGYRYEIKSGGERSAEPERNPERTLVEGLESLFSFLTKADSSDTLQTNSTNASGTPYLSALPGR